MVNVSLIAGFCIWVGDLIKYLDMIRSGIYNKYYDTRDSEQYYFSEIWSYKTMAHMLRPNNEIPLKIKRILM